MKIGKIALTWCVLILVALPATFFFTGVKPIEDIRNNPSLRLVADVTFDKPAAVKETVTQVTDMSKMNFGEVTNDQATLFNTDMTVTEVDRGAKAFELLQKADGTVAAAPDGFEYLLAKVHTHFTSALSTTTWLGAIQLHWDLKNEDFHCFSQEQVAYPAPYIPNLPTPNMKFNIIMISSDSDDTWVAFQVATTDLKPRMYYGTDQMNFWFALYK